MFHSSSDIFPVLARVSELKRLGTFPAIGLCDPDGKDAGVHEGKDQVARRDFAHLTRRKDFAHRSRSVWATKDILPELHDGRSGSGSPRKIII